MGEAHRLGHLAIVVAHPDDEVIGVGGQLLRWTPAWDVTIVSITDGAPPSLRDAHAAGFPDVNRYAEARRQELNAALARLPRQPAVIHLGARDQRVTDEIEAVLDELARLLRAMQPDIVVTHAYEGGHPDHDAVAFAVHTLARTASPRFFQHLEFAGYHENVGGGLTTNRFPDRPVCDAIRIRLTAEERRVKHEMLTCFATQQVTLAPFLCHDEWLRVAPPCDFSQPPNQGRVWYEYFGWGPRSRDWCARMAAVSMPAPWGLQC